MEHIMMIGKADGIQRLSPSSDVSTTLCSTLAFRRLFANDDIRRY
jgi:hypothetical protein